MSIFPAVSTGKSLKADNIAPTAWVPNFHFVAPINDQFGWGRLSPLTMVWPPSTTTIMPPGMGGKTDLKRST
jgi:long-chain fatty acid transport protein